VSPSLHFSVAIVENPRTVIPIPEPPAKQVDHLSWFPLPTEIGCERLSAAAHRDDSNGEMGNSVGSS
jgi:hypothetical protein